MSGAVRGGGAELVVGELRALKRRLAELEAAAALRGLAPDSGDGAALAEVCVAVGLGVRVVLSSARHAEAATKRAVCARVLRREGWTVARIAGAMMKSERAVYVMLRRGRVG